MSKRSNQQADFSPIKTAEDKRQRILQKATEFQIPAELDADPRVPEYAKLMMKQMIELLKEVASLAAPTPTIDPEEKERLRSLVIGGLPETNGNAAQRRASNKNMVTEILDSLDVEAEAVCVYRMGKMENGRSRLLKVVMPSSGIQREVLKKSKEARGHSFHQNRGNNSIFQKFTNLFIRPSLSPAQLEHRKELVLERDNKNKEEDGGVDPYVLWGPPGMEALIRKSEIKKKTQQ